jgi:hypothetical protein
MARYSAGKVSTGAGSTTLPVMGLTAVASVGAHLREVGAFNTTSTALNAGLFRMTAAGTPGATVASIQHDPNSVASSCLVKDTWTVTGTFSATAAYNAQLGAAVGSGIVWVFGDSGLVVPTGTANGIVLMPLSGTGQILNVYFVWDE